MRHHVPSQVAGLRESHVTCLAGIRLLSRMRPHVSTPFAGRFERLVTRLAYVRLLPRMRPHVRIHGQGLLGDGNDSVCLGTEMISHTRGGYSNVFLELTAWSCIYSGLCSFWFVIL